MSTVGITVKMTGPFFKAPKQSAIRHLLDDITKEVADDGLSEVQTLMDAAFKNPTPYYETMVIADRVGHDMVIHDRGIVYGPWLEGVGSRNKTTRFKGYSHWRRTFQYLKKQVDGITERIVGDWVRSMN